MRVTCLVAVLWCSVLVMLGSAGKVAAQGPAGDLVITEFMAINDNTLTDEDGDYSDWLELHNRGSTAVSLLGYYLTDDALNLTKWQLPDVALGPGGYLVVFASNKDRGDPFSELHTNFKLSGSGEYLALVEPDGVTVAHQYAPAFPPQTPDISYGLTGDFSSERCFINPTPGAANDESQTCGFVDDLQFSVEHGFFGTPFALEISTATVGATIRYTLDGSAPSETRGTVYSGPINVNGTTTLRAIGYKSGLQPTAVATRTYIFLDDVISQTGAGFPDKWAGSSSDYEMDPDVVNDPLYSSTIKEDLKAIPSLSIVMDVADLFGQEEGVYSHPEGRGVKWERPASAELIYADGTPGFQVNCGVRIQGGLSRSPRKTKKHSLRLLFKTIYGPSKLKYPLFQDSTVDVFNTLSLRMAFNDSWPRGIVQAQYLRDQFARDTQLDMGQPASHGRFVHLYLNGLYWGLYNVLERPDAAFAAEHFGGNEEDWDALNSGEVIDGDKEAWKAAQALADQGLETAQAYDAIQQYVDVSNLIDYMITNMYIGAIDWDRHNWYAVRKREPGAGYKFFCWDSELSLKTVNARRVGLNNDGNPTRFYGQLRKNPEFRMLFADHLHRHFFHGGALTAEKATQRFLRLSAEIDRAVVGESARWGDTGRESNPFTRDDEWFVEHQRLLLAYFPRRSEIVLDQFRGTGLYPQTVAPEFSQHGGRILPGYELTMSAPDGVIYYTVDGSDPRLPGGAVAGSAQVYAGPLTVNETTEVKARALSGGEWSALNEATFVVDVPLRVTELMYHPRAPSPGSPYTADDFEFIEVTNIGSAPYDITGVSFTDGITFVFPSLILNPGEYVLAVKNLAAFEARYGTGLPVAGEYSGKLSNGGERVVLEDLSGQAIHDFTYDDGWHPSTDGSGYSLVVIDSAAEVDTWSEGASWRPSTFIDGSPAAAELPHCSDGVDNDGDGLVDYPNDPGCGSGGQDFEDPECDDGIDNDADGAIDMSDPQCTAAWDTAESNGPGEHFMCYVVRASRGAARFAPVDVDLGDDFDATGTYTVRKPRVICLPAAAGGTAVVDPATYLEGYQIMPAVGTPAHNQQTKVVVTNRFGPIFIDTIRPDLLLVPTAMDPDQPVDPPDSSAHTVDHFKCYKVRLTRGEPTYFPAGVSMSVGDQFEDRLYDIRKPRHLCLPVDKNGEGIKDPNRRLLCYQVRRSGGEARHTARLGLFTNNQFGPERLDTKRESELCVPSQ